MDIIFELHWFDKITDELAGQRDVSHLFSKKELRILFNEQGNLDGNYLLKTKQQKKFIEQRLCEELVDKYDYFIRFCGDYTLDYQTSITIAGQRQLTLPV